MAQDADADELNAAEKEHRDEDPDLGPSLYGPDDREDDCDDRPIPLTEAANSPT